MAQRAGSQADSKRKNAAAKGGGKALVRVPKPAALVIGDALEYRLARLYIFMGYFVRRGCPIYTISSLDQATDLDVMGLRYLEPMRRELLITECKGGNSAPLDRIFWLTGVRQYVGATQAYLVRRGTKWNIKDFAKECGVQIFDLSRLGEVERALKISKSDWPGISDRSFFQAEQAGWDRTILTESRYWELYQTLRSEIRYDDPFAGVNYLLSQLRIITRSWKTKPPKAVLRFLISEAITQLAVFLLRIMEVSFNLAASDRHGLVRKGLTYGNLEPQYADRILNSAYNMTRQAIVHYTNKSVDIDRALFSMPVPPGTDEIITLVDDLVAAYPLSLTLPQICDLILFEIFTKQKDAGGWLKRIFPQSDLSGRVDVARKFVAVLASIGACPPYVLDSIQAGSENKSRPQSELKPNTDSQDRMEGVHGVVNQPSSEDDAQLSSQILEKPAIPSSNERPEDVKTIPVKGDADGDNIIAPSDVGISRLFEK